jgi:hypothetical protein
MKINLSLIADKRYSGEAPARLRRSNGGGMVQGRSNRRPEVSLSPAGEDAAGAQEGPDAVFVADG